MALGGMSGMLRRRERPKALSGPLPVPFPFPPMRHPAFLFPFALALALSAAAGCAPAIGDSCDTALDCSINGDRQCDLGRPNGACTVFGCEADNCPDDSVCVRWRPDPSRLSFTACMRRCEEDTNCRVDEGFACMAAAEIGTTPEGGDAIAEVVDLERPDEMFCVATEPNVPGEEEPE